MSEKQTNEQTNEYASVSIGDLHRRTQIDLYRAIQANAISSTATRDAGVSEQCARAARDLAEAMKLLGS